MFRGSVRGSHRTKLWGMLPEAQISAKIGRMKAGTEKERPRSKKPKKAETEGKEQGKKKSECRKKNPIKNLRKVGSD